ncbi:hypothetical protein H8356DRAFT_1279355 [Neocallimastix lanati (nom. inval.)]|nr:hypothetical protein H8356DRAFT_1279355 [Neocallimastix sp. JGI-2020a]
MSYALNKSGYTIKSSDGHVSSGKTSSDFKESGIIVFKVTNFSNATGHVDLYNGKTVEGKDYCNDSDWNVRIYQYEIKCIKKRIILINEIINCILNSVFDIFSCSEFIIL